MLSPPAIPSNAHFCSLVVNPTLSQAAINALIPSDDLFGLLEDFAGGIVGIDTLLAVAFTGFALVPVTTGVPSLVTRLVTLLSATAARFVGAA